MPKKPKILLVDDEPLIIDIYAQKFRQSGMTVATANSVDEGWQAVQQAKPDVVFIDIVMPKKNGFHLLKQIKKQKDPSLADTPVIMLTNLDDPDTRRMCSKLGCLYYLVKPLHKPSDLVEMVKDIVAARSKPARR